MNLDLHISTGGKTPIYRQIIDQIRRALIAGTRVPGDPLPSVRALAEQLVVNPNTVARAYGELTRDGLLDARPGKGFFVSDKRQVYSKAERARRLDEALEDFVGETLILDFSSGEIVDALRKKLAALKAARTKSKG